MVFQTLNSRLVSCAMEDNPVYTVYGWQGETDALREKRRPVSHGPLRRRATNSRRRSSKQTSWSTGDLDMKLIEIRPHVEAIAKFTNIVRKTNI